LAAAVGRSGFHLKTVVITAHGRSALGTDMAGDAINDNLNPKHEVGV
jgi:hypothetical protein